MNLPADNYILLSLINTALRDKYSSLEILCEEEGLDEEEITARLGGAGFVYDERGNAFRSSL